MLSSTHWLKMREIKLKIQMKNYSNNFNTKIQNQKYSHYLFPNCSINLPYFNGSIVIGNL